MYSRSCDPVSFVQCTKLRQKALFQGLCVLKEAYKLDWNCFARSRDKPTNSTIDKGVFMKVATMTVNMTLASYQPDNSDDQIVKMAKRYKRKCITPSTKRTLNRVITSPKPTVLVRTVYEEVLNVSA